MVIVTEFENRFNDAYKSEGIITLQQQLFCFHCHSFYTFEHNDKPGNCRVCGVLLEAGGYARPDIVMKFQRETIQKKMNELMIQSMAESMHQQALLLPMVYSSGQEEARSWSYSVVRVDSRKAGTRGNHLRSKKSMMHDYHQFSKFREAGIPVFIVYNDEIDDNDPWVLTAMARYFYECSQNPAMYERYLRQKSIIERTRRPL